MADLRGADLSRADVSQAILAGQTFADIDLSTVQGLETVKHREAISKAGAIAGRAETGD
jgi:uncharacterized protein YjbI with pentapeptide repeats